MFLGEIVEVAVAEILFENPLHPYSQALISAVPIPDRTEIRERILLKGEVLLLVAVFAPVLAPHDPTTLT